MLVRVDDDAVGVGDRAERTRTGDELVEQREEPAVRRVDVDAHAVPLAQRDRPLDRVHRPEPGRARGDDDRADVARCAPPPRESVGRRSPSTPSTAHMREWV